MERLVECEVLNARRREVLRRRGLDGRSDRGKFRYRVREGLREEWREGGVDDRSDRVKFRYRARWKEN